MRKTLCALLACLAVVACSEKKPPAQQQAPTEPGMTCDQVVADVPFAGRAEVVTDNETSCVVRMKSDDEVLPELGIDVSCAQPGTVDLELRIDEVGWALDREATSKIDNGDCDIS